MNPRRPATLFLIALTLALSACGDDNNNTSDATISTATTEGDQDDVQVIRDWSEALTEGDTKAAAEFFALPSVAENGVAIKIEARDDAVLFNESLPCGAELESTEADGDLITATFRLDTRPGVAECPGDGDTAMTSFKIEDGLIVEWIRVVEPGDPQAQDAPVQTT